jgi:hypothetical protein
VKLTKEFAAAFSAYLQEAFAPLTKRLASLEVKLLELQQGIEARSWQGVWEPGKDYNKHNLTTHRGCIWIAVADDPQGTPGSSSDWRLAVKAGRDGR